MTRYRPYLGLGALAGGAVFSFSSLFAGSRWIAPVLAATLGGLAVTAALKRLGLPEVFRVLTSAVAGVWFLAIFIVPGPGILVLVCAGVWAAGLISAPLAIRGRPVLAALPWTGIFALTSSTGAPGNRLVAVLVFIPSLFTALFCIRDSRKTSLLPTPRPPRAQALTLGWATLLGSLATVSGVALGTIVPGYKSPGWLPGGLAGPPAQTVVSPLTQIKLQLLDPGRTKLFEVQASPAGTAPYWRLTALDEFNGNAWGFSAEYSSVGEKISYPPPEAFAGRARSFRQSYRIDRLEGRWLPAAYQATRISGVDASVDPRSSALIARRGLDKGATYQVTSAVPGAGVEDLRRAPPRPARPHADSGGPDPTKLSGVSDEIRNIAAGWTSGKPTPYDKVAAISDRLRKFRYDESVPQGHDADRLLLFLTTSKAGYCEQFAASMAVLVRTLGIPARVAVGFLPGNFDPGQNSYVVTSREAHAWPEVHFEGVGWVAFEPTPRAGISPVTQIQRQEDKPAPLPPAEKPEPSSAQPRPRAASQFWPSAAAVVALLAVLLLTVAAGKRWRIRRRYRKAATPTEKVRAAFFDFEDRMIDLSRPRGIAQTPAEFMEQARTGFQLDRGTTEILVGNFEIAAFSGGDSSDSEAQAAMNAAALLGNQLWAGSNWGGRLSLLVSPRSLLMR